MTSLLEVTHRSLRFGRTTVLRDVSFQVAAGASLAIIGPNGSGKTVLFRALIGAIPFEGTIHWAEGVRIGYVPQKLDIERDVPITGVESLSAHPGLKDADAAVNDTLSLVGLSQEASIQPIGALSGGQFQRLLIAFALVGNPTVLLLDEPTAGVDEPGEERLNALVGRLQAERGLTVLLISHELTIVFRYATNVLCLSRDRTWFNRAGRRARGLEGALVDNSRQRFTSFEPADERAFDIRVAGPSALLVAKLHKVAERNQEVAGRLGRSTVRFETISEGATTTDAQRISNVQAKAPAAASERRREVVRPDRISGGRTTASAQRDGESKGAPSSEVEIGGAARI